MSSPFQFPHDPKDLLRKPIVNELGESLFSDGEPPAEALDNPYQAPQDAAPGYQPRYEAALPHRGQFILILGLVGLVSCLLGSAMYFLGMLNRQPVIVISSCAIGGSLAFSAAGMGRHDLRGMKLGAIDPSGKKKTFRGCLLGVAGALLILVVFEEILRPIVVSLFG